MDVESHQRVTNGRSERNQSSNDGLHSGTWQLCATDERVGDERRPVKLNCDGIGTVSASAPSKWTAATVHRQFNGDYNGVEPDPVERPRSARPRVKFCVSTFETKKV